MRTTFRIGLIGLLLTAGGCSPSSPGPSSSGATPGSEIDVPATAVSSASPATAGSARPSASAGGSAADSAGASASATVVGSATPFTLTSSAFRDGGPIPSAFTCDGRDVSPALDWTGVPGGTRALALTVIDPDAGDFVHWLAYGVSNSATSGLPEAVSPTSDETPQGRNDFGKAGYGGPCPPSGTHHYRFTLSALDRTISVTAATTIEDLKRAIEGHVLGQATLTGTYQGP